ncbi:AI-2E family transporter [Pontivivens ytuae]|uniref:AI-2E family transporter n=1 Tax=Pontivivens ytuae TaxID=2789856 RepID=UPI001E5053C8|nr:AI-2E family transporter [Pontivivens ytuae]
MIETPPSRLRPRPSWAIVGIFLLLLTAAVAEARDFLMPVVLALLLSLVFRPVRRGMNRAGAGDGVAALVICTGLVLAVTALVMLLAQPVSTWVEDAPRIAWRIEQRLASLEGTVEAVTRAAEQLDNLAEGAEDSARASAATQGAEVAVEVRQGGGILAQVAAAAPLLLGQAVFTLVLLFFLLASGDMFYQRIVEVTPRLGDKKRALAIARDIERRLARYLFTITLVNAGLGVAVGLAMWAIGMPDPLMFGVAAFLLNYIPYVGAIAGTVLATAIGIVALPELWLAFAAGAAYFALTSLEGQVVTPYFVGRSLKLNTVVVFLSVAFWAWMWSVVGMIIAVPVLVVVRVFSEHIPAMSSVGRFLAANDAPPPENPSAAA